MDSPKCQCGNDAWIRFTITLIETGQTITAADICETCYKDNSKRIAAELKEE